MRTRILLSIAAVAVLGGGCGGYVEEEESPALNPDQTELASNQFTKGGQRAWFHDADFSAGFFHTYNEFQIAGPSDRPRQVRVFVPRDYEVSGRRYPVVYMNDGPTAFFASESPVGKSWRVGETLSALRDQGKVQDLIVVAVAPLDRNREYTHTSFMFGFSCCGLDGYARYLAQHLKPWIDANYRTLSDARNTAIVGSSHGGLAAFYLAARYPERFGNAGCLSSSFWVGLDTPWSVGGSLASSALLSATRTGLASAQHPRLWIDWGLKRDGGDHNRVIEEGATRRGREMARLLQQRYGYTLGGDLLTWEDPVGGHDEDAWAWRFGLLIQAFFPRT